MQQGKKDSEDFEPKAFGLARLSGAMNPRLP